MAESPQFVQTPNSGANLAAARISTGNTNREGTGALATLVTGGANGTRVDRVNIKAVGATTAGMIRFFIADAEGTPNIRLLHEVPVTAIMPTGTVKSFEDEWVRTDGQPLVVLPEGWTLRVSTHNSETFDVVAVVSGDF